MNEGSIPTENIDNPALFYGADSKHGPVAKFKVPDWENKVDSGTGLLYRATRLHRLAGRYDNAILESTLSPHSGILNLARVEWKSRLYGQSVRSTYQEKIAIAEDGILKEKISSRCR